MCLTIERDSLDRHQNKLAAIILARINGTHGAHMKPLSVFRTVNKCLGHTAGPTCSPPKRTIAERISTTDKIQFIKNTARWVFLWWQPPQQNETKAPRNMPCDNGYHIIYAYCSDGLLICRYINTRYEYPKHNFFFFFFNIIFVVCLSEINFIPFYCFRKFYVSFWFEWGGDASERRQRWRWQHSARERTNERDPGRKKKKKKLKKKKTSNAPSSHQIAVIRLL